MQNKSTNQLRDKETNSCTIFDSTVAMRRILKKAREVILTNGTGNYYEFALNDDKRDLLISTLKSDFYNFYGKDYTLTVLCDTCNNPPNVIETNTLNLTVYPNVVENSNSQRMIDYRTFVLPRDFQLLDDTNESFGFMSDGKYGEYEMVNHPTHYNNYSVEVIDMMEKIWGTEATIKWCEMTAFKYRMRVGTKPDNSIEQDLKKERWYLDKAEELREKL